MNQSTKRRRGIGIAALVTTAAVLFAPTATAAPTPPADTTLAVTVSDNFNRPAQSSGFGTADFGGAWTITSNVTSPPAGMTSTTGVSARFLNIPTGKTVIARTSATKIRDSFSSVNYVVPTAGMKVRFSHMARWQTSGAAYFVRALASPGESLQLSVTRTATSFGTETAVGGTVTLPITVNAGTQYTLESWVTGTNPVTLKARAYPTGTAAPAWQLTATDSSASAVTAAGNSGVAAYSGVGATTAMQLRFSQYWATAATPANDYGPRGSLPVGAASYPVPSGAIFVSPTGDDSNPGTQAQPLQTVAAAIAKAPEAGGITIVLRAGEYNTSTTVDKPNLTIQNYPGEAVWFDGTKTVTAFTANGATWTAPTFTEFKHPSSFTANDASPPGTGSRDFINPARPLASWPEQLYVNNVPQRQVASSPAPGEFSIDNDNQTFTMGSDPTGKTVRLSNQNRAFVVQQSGVTLRGFGVRRYATSLSDMGTISLGGANATLENIVVEDSATQGVSMQKPNQVVNRITVRRSGMTNLHGYKTANSIISNSVFEDNNTEGFNAAPAAAAAKLATSRGVLFKNNTFDASDTGTTGLWLDESMVDFDAVGNDFIGNSQRIPGKSIAGIFVELSGTGRIVDNTMTGGNYGLLGVDASYLTVANNTVGGQFTTSIAFWGDDRRNSELLGGDKDPTADNPWKIINNTIINNVFYLNPTDSYGVQFYSVDRIYQTNKTATPLNATDMNLMIRGNVFHSPFNNTNNMVQLGTGVEDMSIVKNTPDDVNTYLGVDWDNEQLTGVPTAAQIDNRAQFSYFGVPSSATITALTGYPTGLPHIGRF